ncbi:hypothetical protein Q5P01_020172 [Channa striata]|uniref:Uncharacterized protein n=1 Tax=Channa striata TaxID=64152 RepID=A0AA88LX61_CHASR|nr:hypothetical protein Q5P01_020172 [Channa striata]
MPPTNASVQSGMFKRATHKTRAEVQGAEEVQEDENTATELPVDQKVAEVVEDEEPNNTDDPLSSKQQELEVKQTSPSSSLLRKRTRKKRRDRTIKTNRTKPSSRQLVKDELRKHIKKVTRS